MARKVAAVRPRAEREDSITQRQRMVRVPIVDLTARIRRERQRKVKRWVWRAVLLLVAIGVALALTWASGKGARR